MHETPRPPSHPRLTALLALVVVALASSGCAREAKRSTFAELHRVEDQLAPIDDEVAAAPPMPASEAGAIDGSLARYLAHAFAHSPELRASFEEWRAAAQRIDQVRRLPEPTVTYAYYIRNIETRVGPQQHRLSVAQMFPWPTKLSAAAAEASLVAVSAQRRFDAHALEIARDVERAYWNLWLVSRARELRERQLVALRELAAIVRARVEAGTPSAGEASQIELAIARTEDALRGADQALRTARADLAAAIGATSGAALPLPTDAPSLAIPTEPEAHLRTAAIDHPRVKAMTLLAESNDEGARKARADYFPALGVGVDWIVTGEALNPATTPDSGKDPLIVSATVRVPLWVLSYRAGVREAEAKAAAFRSRAIAARNQALAELDRTLAGLDDASRRVEQHRARFVPLASETYAKMAEGFAAGKVALTPTLGALRELLDLEIGLYAAMAEHSIKWAELERIVGRAVSSTAARADRVGEVAAERRE